MFWLKPAKEVLVPEETTELRGSSLLSGPKDLESVKTVELKFRNLFRSPQEKRTGREIGGGIRCRAHEGEGCLRCGLSQHHRQAG
jgi:hypothetical protein